MTSHRSSTAPRRGLRRQEAAQYVGIGVTTFDEWVATGRMPQPMRPSPGIVLWDILELDTAFDALHETPPPDQNAGRAKWDDLVKQ